MHHLANNQFVNLQDALLALKENLQKHIDSLNPQLLQRANRTLNHVDSQQTDNDEPGPSGDEDGGYSDEGWIVLPKQQ